MYKSERMILIVISDQIHSRTICSILFLETPKVNTIKLTCRPIYAMKQIRNEGVHKFTHL